MAEKKKNNKLLKVRKDAARKRLGLMTKRLKNVIDDAVEVVKQLEVLESGDLDDNKYAETPGQVELNEMNHTELVAVCQERGLIRAARDIPPEVLVQVLKKEEDEEVLGDPVDTHRKAIGKFLDVYGDTVRPQLRCDENHAECPSARVLECFHSAPEIANYANE